MKFKYVKGCYSYAIIHDGSHECIINHLIPQGEPILLYEPTVFYIHFKSLLKTPWLLLKKRRSMMQVQGFLRLIYRVYQVSLLSSLGIKVAITTVDDSGVFMFLAKHCVGTNFYAIQNGVRNKIIYERSLVEHMQKRNLKRFFCFGNYEADVAKEFGCKTDNYTPVGPFYADKYIKERRGGAHEEIYDICIAGQWTYGCFLNGLFPEMKDAINKSYNFLAGYVERYPHLNVVVACRYVSNHTFSREEQAFYKHLFGDNCVVLSKDRTPCYDLIMQSNCTVGFSSTCILDAIRMGKKGVFLDLSGRDDVYTAYKGAPFIKRNINFDFFEEYMNNTLSVSSEEFHRDNSEWINYFLAGIDSLAAISGYIQSDLEKRE